jgi:endonuclease YncB( thermonuclease family)
VADRYGRTLAYVNIVGGGTDVARSMVKAGWASVYVFTSPFVRLATFDSAQSAAKRAGRGAWSSCGGNFHSLQ